MIFTFLGDVGGGELMLILVFVLIFFGANKIPELARGLGRGMREFRDATNSIRSEIENAGQVPARPAPPQSVAPHHVPDAAPAAPAPPAPPVPPLDQV